MTKKELIDKIKEFPESARICVYSKDNTVHLPNVFVEDVILEDYGDSLGMIIDLVI